MKKTIIFVLFFGQTINSICQTSFIQTGFDTENSYKYCLYIDSNDVDNIWQVGSPNKSIFNAAYSPPNALITDTINTYPINNRSSVYLRFIKYYYNYNLLSFHMEYKLNTDTLNDSCKIEYTVDRGTNWININAIDVWYEWFDGPLISSGSSNGWNELYLMMDITPYNLSEGDTILFKFTFSSDSVDTNKDGWMIDDLDVHLLYDIGIQESSNINPSCQIIYCGNYLLKIISLNNIQTNNYMIELYDVMGQLVFCNYLGNGYENTYYLDSFKKGIYLYKIIDISEKKISQSGKVIIY